MNITLEMKDHLIPDVRFTVGHSEASPQQIEALMPYGLCSGAHRINATGDRPMYPDLRRPYRLHVGI